MAAVQRLDDMRIGRKRKRPVNTAGNNNPAVRERVAAMAEASKRSRMAREKDDAIAKITEMQSQRHPVGVKPHERAKISDIVGASVIANDIGVRELFDFMDADLVLMCRTYANSTLSMLTFDPRMYAPDDHESVTVVQVPNTTVNAFVSYVAAEYVESTESTVQVLFWLRDVCEAGGKYPIVVQRTLDHALSRDPQGKPYVRADARHVDAVIAHASRLGVVGVTREELFACCRFASPTHVELVRALALSPVAHSRRAANVHCKRVVSSLWGDISHTPKFAETVRNRWLAFMPEATMILPMATTVPRAAYEMLDYCGLIRADTPVVKSRYPVKSRDPIITRILNVGTTSDVLTVLCVIVVICDHRLSSGEFTVDSIVRNHASMYEDLVRPMIKREWSEGQAFAAARWVAIEDVLHDAIRDDRTLSSRELTAFWDAYDTAIDEANRRFDGCAVQLMRAIREAYACMAGSVAMSDCGRKKGVPMEFGHAFEVVRERVVEADSKAGLQRKRTYVADAVARAMKIFRESADANPVPAPIDRSQKNAVTPAYVEAKDKEDRCAASAKRTALAAYERDRLNQNIDGLCDGSDIDAVAKRVFPTDERRVEFMRMRVRKPPDTLTRHRELVQFDHDTDRASLTLAGFEPSTKRRKDAALLEQLDDLCTYLCGFRGSTNDVWGERMGFGYFDVMGPIAVPLAGDLGAVDRMVASRSYSMLSRMDHEERYGQCIRDHVPVNDAVNDVVRVVCATDTSLTPDFIARMQLHLQCLAHASRRHKWDAWKEWD